MTSRLVPTAPLHRQAEHAHQGRDGEESAADAEESGHRTEPGACPGGLAGPYPASGGPDADGAEHRTAARAAISRERDGQHGFGHTAGGAPAR